VTQHAGRHRPHDAQHVQVAPGSFPEYYQKLMQDGKVGLRWRTEKEVVAGKGQFVCGARGCDVRQGLASFEVRKASPHIPRAVAHHVLTRIAQGWSKM
jgi:Folate-sensitive fragile site protein Fra10Ac1